MVTAATNSGGTIFYRVTLDLAKDIMWDLHKILYGALCVEGWNCVDLTYLPGSDIIDDDLYLCVTDGTEINMDGEDIDPEEALNQYSIMELAAYVMDADAEVVRKHLTEYEISKYDIDDVAEYLIKDEVHFTDMVQDYNEIFPE